jgi:sterol desaturase/sphingolipid hydroxylase (fatty acid hydroxylase superfamily)
VTETEPAASPQPKVGPLGSANRIITFVLLPVALIAFLMVTLTSGKGSAIIFGLGLVALLLVEVFRRWLGRSPTSPDVYQDAAASLTLSVILNIVNGVILVPVMFIWMTFVSEITPLHLQTRLSDALGPWAIPVTLALVLALADFLYYWAHRGGHRIELLWGSHSVHHSSEHFNPTTATRISFLDELWDMIMMSSICLLGIGPQYALGAYALILLYQLPLHQTWLKRLPRWYEFTFNTPEHHRAHHAFQKAYIDRNFGGILIVWDRMFGSYADVEADLPPAYGLTVPVGTYNPLRVLFHELAVMGRNVAHATSARERFGYVFRQPYWKPIEN